MNDGGSAFPIFNSEGFASSTKESCTGYGSGMTLRDYFAAKVLQGLASIPIGNQVVEDVIRCDCQTAYKYADAMIAARERKA